MEAWLAVPGYEGSYEVSDQGRVRSLSRVDARGRTRRQQMLRTRRSPSGALSVALYRDSVRADLTVHSLVLSAFVGPRPEGLDCCHWNDDPSDNRLSNLRWGTRSENVRDSVRNGTHSMASRSTCPSGHPYTPENTYRYPRGNRACVECRRIYRELHREERRAADRIYMQKKRALARAATNGDF